MTHEMQLRQEPFECIVHAIKTIELRLYDEKRQRINIGDKIRFSRIDNPKIEEEKYGIIGIEICIAGNEK